MHFVSPNGWCPACLEEKLEWARCRQTPQRVVHYQVGGCIGGNICFRYDLRLSGAVAYRKDKQILCDFTKKFLKITVVCIHSHRTKSIYTVPYEKFDNTTTDFRETSAVLKH